MAINTINQKRLKNNDGWQILATNPTYVSATTVQFADGVIDGKIRVGMKIKLSNPTVKYFIVTLITDQGASGDTLYLYGGTDYTVDNSAITNLYYSNTPNPIGFPLEKSKWSASLIDVTQRIQPAPTVNVWYSPGGLSLAVPPGLWDIDAKLFGLMTTGNGNNAIQASVSNANNADNYTVMNLGSNTNPCTQLGLSYSRNTQILLPSASTLYPIIRYMTATGGSTTLYFQNIESSMVIKAVCAYL